VRALTNDETTEGNELMDPNEALRLIRLTIKQMRVDTDPGVRAAHAEEIAVYFEGLDKWLSNDGFIPDDWRSEDEKAGRAPLPEAYQELLDFTRSCAHNQWLNTPGTARLVLDRIGETTVPR